MYKHFNEKNDPNMIGLNTELMERLDSARDFAEVPFIITSGLRTPEHNAEVGGVTDSAHLKGLAVDLLTQSYHTTYSIVYGLFMAGFKRIEITKDHIHADIDTTKAQEVLF